MAPQWQAPSKDRGSEMGAGALELGRATRGRPVARPATRVEAGAGVFLAACFLRFMGLL